MIKTGNSATQNTNIEETINTSKALQKLMERAQIMIKLSLVQDEIMKSLGLDREKMQNWYHSLPASVKKTLDDFNREVELLEKKTEIEFSYKNSKNQPQKTAKTSIN